ncbi:hypothetical protein Pmani_027317 [Petrolisthes manimaculis]|uniref:Uncharacterized protein n=1 Tax=Petrolisthes manimaculis TaxID=1843537 RepID=A0AAE1P415_9EUCA|nr:hypothetical protein Pmani_027317 [Petrolisthes manimaculis]
MGVVVGVQAVLPLPQDPHQPQQQHTRHARQIHHLLDPFGLLGKAGEAVSGAVEGLGKTLDQGAQHVGQMVQDGAASIDSVLKTHVDKVQAGLEEAGKVASIVGEDLVDSMSTLVNNHLQVLYSSQAQQQGGVGEDEVMRRENNGAGMTTTRREGGVLDTIFRMFGIDTSQVGLMALNVLIFLAELITSSLIGENLNDIPESRSGETSVLSWFLNGNPGKVAAMLREAQDPGLPRAIIEKLVKATGDETACVQLLVCKLSPVVWGLQRSVKDTTQARSLNPEGPQPGLMQMLYDALPPLNDFVAFSESCEVQFPSCPLLHLAELGL